MSETTTGSPDVLAPATLGPVTLRNRVIKAATYEGLSHRGYVTNDLVDFHREYAAGGVGMTTVAYCAVAKDGRTDKHQILWRDKAMPGLRKLTEAVRAEGSAISAQIGHAGPVANARANRSPALAPSRKLNPMSGTIAQPVDRSDIQRIVTAHADAARSAAEAGFDAVEVHLGHNYLVSSFLSPKLNRRSDDYGGSLTNRARFAREILRAVSDAVGGELAIIAKMNMDDGARGGFWLDEAIAVARLFEADGTLDALELTAGSSLLNPMYMFKGDAPLDDFAGVMPQPFKLGAQLVGGRFLHSYPYRDAYLLEDARQIRAEVNLPMILLGGITSKDVMDTAMDSGFQYVAMARALLREPDLINRIQKDHSTPSLCIHCNKCMPTNYTGTRCALINRKTSRGPDWGTKAGYAAAE